MIISFRDSRESWSESDTVDVRSTIVRRTHISIVNLTTGASASHEIRSKSFTSSRHCSSRGWNNFVVIIEISFDVWNNFYHQHIFWMIEIILINWLTWESISLSWHHACIILRENISWKSWGWCWWRRNYQWMRETENKRIVFKKREYHLVVLESHSCCVIESTTIHSNSNLMFWVNLI